MPCKNIELRVANRIYCMQTLILDKCIFLWVGAHCELNSLCFARSSKGLVLLETLDTAHANLDSFTGKISNLFPEKQLFFGTDLKSEDSLFWLELLQRIAEEVLLNRLVYRIPSETLAISAV